ncbi:MAG TPA: GIY-YIG nuclease family protein [Bacteroidota bacterium]|nr:GIY-YIG nuclease family protein [Bacteroidota bacterium]
MPLAKSLFFKRCAEGCPRSEVRYIPRNTRGIYTLLKKESGDTYRVVYVGMAGGAKAGIHGRLNSHKSSKRKGNKWDYFSFFEVWDNVSKDEVTELEGILRHIYRKDQNVNELCRQRSHKPFIKIRNNNLKDWKNQ